MKIVTQEEMRALEQRAVDAGVPLDTLMENAGLAVARWIASRLGFLHTRRVLVLVGPGNNGSDGLVAARHLSRLGASVTCYVCIGRPADDPKRKLAVAHGVQWIEAGEDEGFRKLRRLAGEAHVVLDAILGIGRARAIIPPISDEIAAVLEASRASRPLFVALDLQSGLNADSGEFDPSGIQSSVVLTLGAPKLGLFLRPLVDPYSSVVVLDIGIPPGADDGLRVDLMSRADAAALLPERPLASNKGTYGRAMVVGGSKSYVGAASLAARAAGKAGAGIVTLAAPRSVAEIVSAGLAECTYVPLVESEPGAPDPEVAGRQIIQAAERISAMLIGPGLGQTPYIGPMLRRLMTGPLPEMPIVLDADGLNALSKMRDWWVQFRRPGVLTPHPGELARLLDTTIAEIQSDRLAVARAAAAKFGYVVILKGACTIVASPDGRARISPFANPGLASGGTGDVLAGVVVGLLAQRMTPFDAATLAVYAHGMAGHAARDRFGEMAMTATNVLEELPAALQALESAKLPSV